MADGTKIEWTDATVNAVNGCSVISPGCTNCYAMKLAGTRLRNHPSRAGLTQDSKAGPVWNGKIHVNEKALLEPLRWRRPRKIFWNAHGDLFHPNVPDEVIDRCFAVMALTPQHIHQVLTKRSDRMRDYFTQWGGYGRWGYIEHEARQLVEVPQGKTVAHFGGSNLPNVWLGVSVEDQARADQRIPDLLATPAAVRFLSCEPLLGPVDLTALPGDGCTIDALDGIKRAGGAFASSPKISWVIVGGESGSRARAMHPDWARDLRDQCAAAGVPFFFKQWGNWRAVGPIYSESDTPEHLEACEVAAMDEGRDCIIAPNGGLWPECQPPEGSWVMERVGKQAAGRLLDGVQHDGMPAHG